MDECTLQGVEERASRKDREVTKLLAIFEVLLSDLGRQVRVNNCKEAYRRIKGIGNHILLCKVRVLPLELGICAFKVEGFHIFTGT